MKKRYEINFVALAVILVAVLILLFYTCAKADTFRYQLGVNRTITESNLGPGQQDLGSDTKTISPWEFYAGVMYDKWRIVKPTIEIFYSEIPIEYHTSNARVRFDGWEIGARAGSKLNVYQGKHGTVRLLLLAGVKRWQGNLQVFERTGSGITAHQTEPIDDIRWKVTGFTGVEALTNLNKGINGGIRLGVEGNAPEEDYSLCMEAWRSYLSFSGGLFVEF